MPENTTDAVETAPVSTDVLDPEAMTTEEYLAFIGAGFEDSSTVADIPAFDAGVATIVEEMPLAKKAQDSVDKAVGAQSAIRARIAQAIISVRAAVEFHGKPDTFGVSDAYRVLYEQRITKAILRANPKLDPAWVKGELKAVRTGYLNESGTRAKAMVHEAIIRDAALSGEIEGAEVREDGKIVIPQFVKDRNTGETVPKTVLLKDAETGKPVKDAEGNTVKVPAVLTYTPGQKENVPGIVKDIVRKTVNERDRKGKDGKPMTTIPSRFGGAKKPSGGGGDTSDEPRNWADEMQTALATFTEDLGHTATLFQVQAFHVAASVLVQTLNRKDLTQPKEHAAILEDVWQLLKIECAILNDHRGTKLEDLTPFMAQTTDAPKDAEQAPEQEKDAEQDQAPEPDAEQAPESQ